MKRGDKWFIFSLIVFLILAAAVISRCAPAGAYPESDSTFEYRQKTPDGYGYTEWETPRGMVCISIAGDYFHCEFPR
jgi:hypothetical protein